MNDQPFRLLGEQVRHQGHIVSMATTTWLDPATGEEFDRDVVRHPGAVAVVPVLGDGDDRTVVLVRQFRTSLGRALLEIPAGLRDVDGEAPEDTARRELVEEAGYVAGRLDLLVELDTAPGFSDEVIPVYLATDLTATERQADGIEERSMTVEHHPLRSVGAMVAAGEVTDAKTVAGLWAAVLRLTR